MPRLSREDFDHERLEILLDATKMIELTTEEAVEEAIEALRLIAERIQRS